MLRAAFPIVAVLLALAPGARADRLADGQDLVERRCARCHAVQADAQSPHPDAPPFAEVAVRYDPDDLAEAFAEGVVVGHADMPAFELTASEIEALIAYLDSLKP